MSDQIIPYLDNEGCRRWAIWSTITDGFVAHDMSACEVIHHEAAIAYENQKRRTLEYMEEYVNDGDIPYFGYSESDFERRLQGEYELGEGAGVPEAQTLLVGDES